MAKKTETLSVSKESRSAEKAIRLAGKKILSEYDTKPQAIWAAIRNFFKHPFKSIATLFTNSLTNVIKGKAECEKFYQDNDKTVDKLLASNMLDIAAYAWAGHEKSEPSEYKKLSKEEIPQSIRCLYDAKTGLLCDSTGLKAWIGKKDTTIVISHAGTDVSDVSTIAADIIQLSAPSDLYLKASGLLNLMLEQHPTSDFYVTGHSLGGGLSQFSVTANLKIRTNIQGYGYNPAGLSMTSLKHLGKTRLDIAKQKMWIFSTPSDPVSIFGGQLGCYTILPASDHNGHGIGDLKECMLKYIQK